MKLRQEKNGKARNRLKNIVLKTAACAAAAVTMAICQLSPLSASAETQAGTSAKSMLLLEASTNRVLYSKNADIKLPMASTTKIVTAITVLDYCQDLNKVIKIPAAAVGVEGSSIYLEKDEELSVNDLLHGLMLQSGNDCAAALAISTAGSIKDFAELMNETAKKAGAVNSNFVNPHGLHDDNHYTTARDLALITSYAMKNPVFKKITSTKRYTAPWKGRNYDRVILNKNKLLNSFDGADGVKTGFTKKAGRCLVSSATRNGMQVICVVLNCGPMFEDCAALMEKAFREYQPIEIIGELKPDFICEVEEGQVKTVKAASRRGFCYPLSAEETGNIRIVTETKKLCAPFKKGTEAGKVQVYLGKQLLFEEKLYTIEAVDSLSIIERLKDLVERWTG